MNIITKRLDIFYLFKKLYEVGEFQNIVLKKKIIEMSKESKLKLKTLFNI